MRTSCVPGCWQSRAPFKKYLLRLCTIDSSFLFSFLLLLCCCCCWKHNEHAVALWTSHCVLHLHHQQVLLFVFGQTNKQMDKATNKQTDKQTTTTKKPNAKQRDDCGDADLLTTAAGPGATQQAEGGWGQRIGREENGCQEKGNSTKPLVLVWL